MTSKKLLAWMAAGAVAIGALILLAALDPGRSSSLRGAASVFAVLLGYAVLVSGSIMLSRGLPWDRQEKIERRIEELERWHRNWDAEHG